LKKRSQKSFLDARDTNRESAIKIQLIKDEAGQYQHGAAIKYAANVKRELANFFNLLNSDNGMAKLCWRAQNTPRPMT
jgi:hypothetical protein